MTFVPHMGYRRNRQRLDARYRTRRTKRTYRQFRQSFLRWVWTGAL